MVSPTRAGRTEYSVRPADTITPQYILRTVGDKHLKLTRHVRRHPRLQNFRVTNTCAECSEQKAQKSEFTGARDGPKAAVLQRAYEASPPFWFSLHLFAFSLLLLLLLRLRRQNPPSRLLHPISKSRHPSRPKHVDLQFQIPAPHLPFPFPEDPRSGSDRAQTEHSHWPAHHSVDLFSPSAAIQTSSVCLPAQHSLSVDSDFRTSKENVTVTVRFRPLSPREINRGDEIAWYADGDYTVRNEYNASVAYGFGQYSVAFGCLLLILYSLSKLFRKSQHYK
ncbi:hypothetical protein ACLOJK_014089 [Asimina triloba]